MKKARMQIRRRQSLLTFGVVVLMATMVLGANRIPQPSRGRRED